MSYEGSYSGWRRFRIEKLLSRGEKTWEVVVSKDDPDLFVICPECKQRCEVRESKICNYEGEYEQWTDCCHVPPYLEGEEV